MTIDKAFLSAGYWEDRFYSGGWRQAARSQEIFNPASGAKLYRVGVADAADVQRAAKSAKRAQAAWTGVDFDRKAGILRNTVRVIEDNTLEIVDSIIRESGSTAPKAQFEVGITVRCLHEAAAMPSQPQGLVLPSPAGRMSFARRMPLGVVGVISPFNFPLYLAMRAVAPALAAGNAVVLKPDLRTPLCGGFVIARIFQQAGLPDDLLHVLPGPAETGEALCTDPNISMIQFTGSSNTGRRVGSLAGQHLKKVSLELGGKSSLIVLADADLDVAASNAGWGAYLHQGQICMAAGRILVERPIAEELIAKIAARAGSYSVGDPSSGQFALGPMINQHQRDKTHAIVQDSVSAGATLVEGGTYENLFYRPTVLSGVRPGMRAFEEEIFGPVVSVTEFSSDDEAVELANDTEYGLAGGVISRSVDRAMALGNRLNVGLLHIHDQTINDEVVNPFGGRGRSGNGGSIGGPANWEAFTQWQWVTVRREAAPYPL
ncbi:MAG: benzaldehyde dehydrogenase [Pseudomonadota bacterium]|nr:benzaldehyde dehydrogenase [Pseudomonadota bacterium]